MRAKWTGKDGRKRVIVVVAKRWGVKEVLKISNFLGCNGDGKVADIIDRLDDLLDLWPLAAKKL